MLSHKLTGYLRWIMVLSSFIMSGTNFGDFVQQVWNDWVASKLLDEMLGKSRFMVNNHRSIARFTHPLSTTFPNIFWLVVSTPLKMLASWDYYSQYMGQVKMFQTTNQLSVPKMEKTQAFTASSRGLSTGCSPVFARKMVSSFSKRPGMGKGRNINQLVPSGKLTLENGPFVGASPIQIKSFHSYVNLPERMRLTFLSGFFYFWLFCLLLLFWGDDDIIKSNTCLSEGNCQNLRYSNLPLEKTQERSRDAQGSPGGYFNWHCIMFLKSSEIKSAAICKSVNV